MKKTEPPKQILMAHDKDNAETENPLSKQSNAPAWLQKLTSEPQSSAPAWLQKVA